MRNAGLRLGGINSILKLLYIDIYSRGILSSLFKMFKPVTETLGKGGDGIYGEINNMVICKYDCYQSHLEGVFSFVQFDLTRSCPTL